MLDDATTILLLILAALAVNTLVWVFKDMKRNHEETEEIEHWLEHGENNGN